MTEQKPGFQKIETPVTDYLYLRLIDSANRTLDQRRILEKNFGRSADVVFEELVEEIHRLLKSL